MKPVTAVGFKHFILAACCLSLSLQACDNAQDVIEDERVLRERVEHAYGGAARVFCLVTDNGRVWCAQIGQLTTSYRDHFGVRLSASALRELLEYSIELPDDPTEVMVACGGGEVATAQLGRDFASRIARTNTELVGSDRSDILTMCRRQRITPVIGRIEGSTAPLVAQTKQRMREHLGSCEDGPQAIVSSTVPRPPIDPGRIPRLGIEVVKEYFKAIGTFFETRGDFTEGMNDYLAGKEPQEPLRDSRGTLTPYGQGYESAKRICEGGAPPASCPAPTSDETPDEDDSNDDPPVSDPPPDDPGPGVPQPPLPPTVQCVDEACSSYCERISLWWDQFEEFCDSNGWQAYGCQSLIAAVVATCPDPGRITPTPDGDFECREKMDEEAKELIRDQIACEEDSRLSYLLGPLGPVGCHDLGRPAFDDLFDLIIQAQCQYLYDESGICMGAESLVPGIQGPRPVGGVNPPAPVDNYP